MKRMTITSRVGEVKKVRQAVMAEVEARRYSDDVKFAIRLALDEALANAIHHGNRRDPAKRVTVEYEVGDESVAISVSDQGQGFSPERVPDPRLDENLQKPCGRGIMLMQDYMSRVQFNDRGNRITLVKERNCGRPYGVADV